MTVSDILTASSRDNGRKAFFFAADLPETNRLIGCCNGLTKPAPVAAAWIDA
ncbi:MAG TPA: hypothetical protein PLV92_24845 [Pirellulaceae bacterium]|nr:hypothetical protein [Pirellulaceae bacterium]